MEELLLIDRIDAQKDSTRSDVWIKGIKSRYKMLEDIVREPGVKVWGETAIPADVYELTMRPSPKFSRLYMTIDDVNLIERKEWLKLPKAKRDLYHEHDVIHVENVPNYSEILHHWGNTCKDTHGCGLVGLSTGRIGQYSAVLSSRAAYVAYYAEVAPLIRAGGQKIRYRNSFVK